MEVPQAADHVIAEHLPLLVRHLDAVLVLEERDGLLRALAVAPGREPLHSSRIRRTVSSMSRPSESSSAGVEDAQRELHGFVDGPAGPPLPAGSCLSM